jgi:hypothetical protein
MLLARAKPTGGDNDDLLGSEVSNLDHAFTFFSFSFSSGEADFVERTVCLLWSDLNGIHIDDASPALESNQVNCCVILNAS